MRQRKNIHRLTEPLIGSLIVATTPAWVSEGGDLLSHERSKCGAFLTVRCCQWRCMRAEGHLWPHANSRLTHSPGKAGLALKIWPLSSDTTTWGFFHLYTLQHATVHPPPTSSLNFMCSSSTCSLSVQLVSLRGASGLELQVVFTDISSSVPLLEICSFPLGVSLGMSAVGPLVGDLLIW